MLYNSNILALSLSILSSIILSSVILEEGTDASSRF